VGAAPARKASAMAAIRICRMETFLPDNPPKR
jgi:hypothetical protein